MIATGLRLKVFGLVQGVGFRDYVRRKAMQENVTGIARNLHDGSVEVLLYGEKSNISRVQNAIRTGPSSSRVDAVQTNDLYDTPLQDFITE
ncbi:MAG: acylphosphatase [Endozoicomonadaceae bacterium]|nr:acylphosphatase [Endozoicomonadaceae bacterium]